MVDDPGPPAPAGRDVRRGLQLGTRLVVATLSLLTLVGSGLAWATYQNFTESVPHGAAVPKLAANQHDVDGSDQNILLLGNDSRAGATPDELRALGTQDDGGSVNTDTMMLLHLPGDGRTATVVSFPRDSWVDIPGNGKGKINSAYGLGYVDARNHGANEVASESAGIALLIRTINQLTGLHVDHYAQVNLLGFYRISNAIGGVQVCLNAAQNPETDSDAYGKGYSGINLPAGVSTIKGSQALAFVRQRHGLPNGDLDRIKRQQYFLSAAFHQVASAGVLLNPFKLRDLLKAISSSLLTDPGLDLVSLATEFQNLSTGKINFATLPNSGAQLIYPDGVATSIIQVDTAAIPNFVRRLAGQPADPALSSVPAAAPSTVTVDVLNGTTVAGLAGRNAAALRAAGFVVNTVDSTHGATATAVEYPAGQQAAAKAVAAAVPGATLNETPSVQRVTVVLGSDGRQVRGVGGSASSSAAPSSATAGSGPSAAESGTAGAPASGGASTATPAPVGGPVACIN
jgi:LCP family protein required for cell wall assembly